MEELGDIFRESDKPHLKMSTFRVIFQSDEETKKQWFIFKRFDADKGITCFRSEALRIAGVLPEMFYRLAKTQERFDATEDKTGLEGHVNAEIIQANEKFEKRLEIHIYKQRPMLSLTLYLKDTDDGQPRPCPGSVVFKDGEDDPKALKDFILKWMPEKEKVAYKKKYSRILM
jgi:hypothetical protein